MEKRKSRGEELLEELFGPPLKVPERRPNIEIETTLTEEEMALPGYTFDQFCADVDASLISGRPNVRERSHKKGTKYISEEMDKLKRKYGIE